MIEIDKFLSFINENLDDERISVYKEMKYGHRHYHIDILLKHEHNTTLNTSIYNSYNQLSITLDNRNKCIVISSSESERSITIENDEMLNKWNKIFEDFLTKNLEDDVKDMIHNVMSKMSDRDLYREYQMKKIFKK